ncbi:MAG: hypothetical protein HN719_07575 [Alphaproteobacteria bacterium]|nr:hypothetical protein [Alphaproteobacteria bacterium]
MPETFEQISLESLLDPQDKRKAIGDGDNDLSKAFHAFYQQVPEEAKKGRDRIQDRLIAASNQRCNVYKTYLKRLDSHAGFFFGALSTVLGGAGAIVTGEAAARTLSGLAGITSGVGAEYEKSFFANVATHFIIPGIDQRRDEILLKIETNRNGDNNTSVSVDKYTVERAVADASDYHGACSMNVGLTRSGKLVDQALTPGTETINKVLDEIIKAQKKMKQISSGVAIPAGKPGVKVQPLPTPKK